MPAISLNPKANYKTQESFYDTMALANGRLTDRKIVAYAKAGRYGPEVQQRFCEKHQGVRQQKLTKALALVNALLNE